MAMPPYLRKAPKAGLSERILPANSPSSIVHSSYRMPPPPIGTPLSPRELVDLLAAETNILVHQGRNYPDPAAYQPDTSNLIEGDCAGRIRGRERHLI